MFHPKSLLFYFRKYYPLFLFTLTAALTTHSAHAMMSPDEEDVEIVLSSKDEIISHALDKITPYSGSNSSSHIHFNEAAFKLLLPSLYAVLYAKRQNHKPRDIEAILKNSDNSTSDNSFTFAEMLELWNNKCCENSKELFDTNVLEDLNEKFRSCKTNNDLTDQVYCIFKPYVKSSDGIYRFVASIFWVYKLCDAWVDCYQKADMKETAEYNIKKDKNNIVSKAQTVFKDVLDQLDADLHSSDFHVLTAHGDSHPLLTLAQALAIIDPKLSPVFTGLSLQDQENGKPTAFKSLTNHMHAFISELDSTDSMNWPKKPFFLNKYIIHSLKQAEEKSDKKTKERWIRTSLTIIEKYNSGNNKDLMTAMMIYNYPDTLWDDEIKFLIGHTIEMKMQPFYDISNNPNNTDNKAYGPFFTEDKWLCFRKKLDRTIWGASSDKDGLNHFLDLLSANKNNDKNPFNKTSIAHLKSLSYKNDPDEFLKTFLDLHIIKGSYTTLKAILSSLASCFCRQCRGQFNLIMDALQLSFYGAETQAIMTMDDLAQAADK